MSHHNTILTRTHSDWLALSQGGSMLPSQTHAHAESESSQDFLKFQQKARERTERDRLLAEQMEQRRKEKDLEDATRRAEAEERTKIRER